jgi:putative heme iron utilization protein
MQPVDRTSFVTLTADRNPSMSLSPHDADLLRSLLQGRHVAALATLHDGRPYASMVPFAATTPGGRLWIVIHVSGLAAHTRDMRSVPEVCLLLTAPESAAVPPQALPRVSITGRATFVPADDPTHGPLKDAYLEKFPEAAELFQFTDFTLVAIEPVSARFVAGFARAMTLSADTLASLSDGGPGSLG